MDRYDTLLISSSETENRKLLRSVLEQRYHLLEARNLSQTLLLLEQNRECIAAMVLDISTMEELKYLNAKTRQLAHQATTGMRCYRALMGKDSRCPGCPALDIRQKKNNSARMENEMFQLETLAEATLIQWEDEESCLLTCREIPKEVTT